MLHDTTKRLGFCAFARIKVVLGAARAFYGRMTQDLSWTVAFMRSGYAGRGLVYLVVSGFSLFAIWYGGQAKGTSSALAQLEATTWGSFVLLLIFLGMIAYAAWRVIEALYDLEDHGTDAKGLVARTGMIVSAVIHLGIAFTAFGLLFTAGGQDGGSSSITEATNAVMAVPAGRWIIAAAGLAILGTGVVYARRALRETYREHLRANHFTTNWNWLLKVGVLAKAGIVAIIGVFAIYAAWTADPSEAGGMQEAFSWLNGQIYGRVLVILFCVGLMGFAVYCFVNAAFRIVPRVAGGNVQSLAAWAKDQAKAAVS